MVSELVVLASKYAVLFVTSISVGVHVPSTGAKSILAPGGFWSFATLNHLVLLSVIDLCLIE